MMCSWGRSLDLSIEIRLRPTRRLDQLRQAQKETVGLNTGSQGRRVDEKPTLSSQGIDKNLAHQQAQALHDSQKPAGASLPETGIPTSASAENES